MYINICRPSGVNRKQLPQSECWFYLSAALCKRFSLAYLMCCFFKKQNRPPVDGSSASQIIPAAATKK